MGLHHYIKSALMVLLFAFAVEASAQIATIDASKKHQTIRGFGGMNHTTWIKDLNEDTREKAFGNDPGKIGLTILRMHLDPNPNQFSLELPTTLHALKNGAIAFATPWNAPTDLTITSGESLHVNPLKYGSYVAHLNAFNTYMADNGAALHAISVQNEPDYGEWTRWTAEEMLNFMQNHAQNIDNTVIAPESFQFRRSFSDPLLNDPKAVQNLEIVGGHIYGGGLEDYPLAREKGKEVWMTEHLLGSGDGMVNNWELALTVGKEIHDCMEANYNAYVWWYIRRSYGLISDDGNITDKGYVFSQFSKFVRPGAIRVDASVSSLPLMDISAYIAGNELTYVIINRGSKDVEVSFNILNSAVAKLTQFTTTETKKVENQGEHIVTAGSFSATIAGKSVTTFTSAPQNGGKQGNINPVASAGEDLTIDDTEGKGTALVTLDGSKSTDTDGTIQNYSWSLNGEQIAWTPTLDLTITIGAYEVMLTVTDNDGASSSDIINLELTSTKSSEIWLESECGIIGSSWQTLTESTASNGKYVETKTGVESAAEASVNQQDHLVYNFTTTETGNYKIWGRVITPTANDDSFWVQVDDSDWVMWNGIPAGDTWHWDDVHNGSGEAQFYTLEPGEHTIRICMREDGAKLDKIVITNTGVIPTEAGGEASSCGPTAIDPIATQQPSIAIYPNPTAGQVTINWQAGFNDIKVINSQGQVVFVKQFAYQTERVSENLNLTPGIYLVLLRNNTSSAVSRLVINKAD